MSQIAEYPSIGYSAWFDLAAETIPGVSNDRHLSCIDNTDVREYTIFSI